MRSEQTLREFGAEVWGGIKLALTLICVAGFLKIGWLLGELAFRYVLILMLT